MRIHLLGTAAGGGVPQWNCNCATCREARAGRGRVLPRSQSSVAVSADDQHWFLLNASPDIRWQIEAFPPLQPLAGKKRSSPIQSVLLTNADLDHALGLILLREGEKLFVHATASVRKSLTEGISLAPALDFFCGLAWICPPGELSPLLCRDGSPSGLLYEALPLPGKPPRFMKGKSSPSPGDGIGYRLVDEKTGGGLLFLPDVAGLPESVVQNLSHCNLLLFDGTFWSEHEMQEGGGGDFSAKDMGHIPVSGADGSLRILAQLQVPNKIYVHINNTNPMLMEDSPERATVTAAGCAVGWDGMGIVI